MPPSVVPPVEIGDASHRALPAFVCKWWHEGPDAARVRVLGELDLATTPRLTWVLNEALEHARVVNLDLRALLFTDSSGVHAIVDASAAALDMGRRVVLVNGASNIIRTFELTGTAGRVEIRA